MTRALVALAVASVATSAGFATAAVLSGLAPCCTHATLWCVVAGVLTPACALGGGWVGAAAWRPRAGGGSP